LENNFELKATKPQRKFFIYIKNIFAMKTWLLSLLIAFSSIYCFEEKIEAKIKR